MLNVGTPTKEILLPIEVCKLASGQRRLKLDPKQTADMIKITAQRPSDRSGRIMRALNEDSKIPADETVKKFGMQVSTQMALVGSPDRKPLFSPPSLPQPPTTRKPSLHLLAGCTFLLQADPSKSNHLEELQQRYFQAGCPVCYIDPHPRLGVLPLDKGLS